MRKSTVIAAVLAAAIATLALYAWGRKSRQEAAFMSLRHFKKDEFGPYWTLMDPALLSALDAFRDLLGYPIEISPARGSIGRPVLRADGTQEENEIGAERSYHNYVLHGAVKAIDVMPKPPGGATPGERQRWVQVAQQAGFTGIGLYPTWKPRAGLHLDVRPTTPARWAWLGDRNAAGHQVYVGIERGYV